MRKLIFIPLLLALVLSACQGSDQGGKTSEGEEAVLAALDSATVRSHLEMLSSDAMEGRGTGQPGEQRAVSYIASHMEAIGLVPGGDDSTYFQKVPLLGSTPSPQTPLSFASENGETLNFAFITDYIAETDLEAEQVNTTGDLVFVGYGIDAPGENWNSYKDVDVRGKILLSFTNDPLATEAEPNLFQGDTLTYYGRWTYKYEEARRRGAKGIFLIHTLETAGYPFTVLSNSAAGEQIQLATPPANPLEVKGWLTEDAARKLAELNGTTLEAWFEQANSRDFEPQALPYKVSLDVNYAVRRFDGINVVGKIPGQKRPDESVVFTAHHDHLGIGVPNEDGDAIYNGAIDNASGVSMLLNLAQAFSQAPPPDRSLVFVTVTAEESGLLGAEYYARNPHLPMAQTIANLNVDSGNVYGRTHDIVGLGAEKSEMMDLLTEAAAAESMTVTPDPHPNQGYFFRSDQLAFARAGVPAVFFNTGSSFIGKPEGYAEQVSENYRSHHYHQTEDEFDPTWALGGLVQQMRVAARMAYRLAYSNRVLEWNPNEAFAQARAKAAN